MNDRQMTSSCGLDCFDCPAHLAMGDNEQCAYWPKTTGKPEEKAFFRGMPQRRRDDLPVRTDRAVHGLAVHPWKGARALLRVHRLPLRHPRAVRRSGGRRAAQHKGLPAWLTKRMGPERWATQKAKAVRDACFTAPFGSWGGT